jgi:hypothetical protein
MLIFITPLQSGSFLIIRITKPYSDDIVPTTLFIKL